MELFIVDSWEEMEDAVSEGHIEVTDILYRVIKNGIKRKFKKVKMFGVALREDPEFHEEWYLEASEYRAALENCLRVYTDLERYEDCADIKKILDNLS